MLTSQEGVEQQQWETPRAAHTRRKRLKSADLDGPFGGGGERAACYRRGSKYHLPRRSQPAKGSPCVMPPPAPLQLRFLGKKQKLSLSPLAATVPLAGQSTTTWANGKHNTAHASSCKVFPLATDGGCSLSVGVQPSHSDPQCSQ